jgi:nucleoid-associated protein YgaU
MKIPKFIPRKKLRATTARRAFGGDEMDEMAEPNMKLSRALLIVLVLHVVAVAGIIAFNAIKSRQGAFPPPVTSASAAKPAASVAPAKVDAAPAPSPAKAVAKEEAAVPRALPVNSENGNSYTVVKGDNPVKIAKKLKVSESELLALNHIDDPRKLRIGQKLIIPKSNKSKKN